MTLRVPDTTLRVLMAGDVVGKPGRDIILARLCELRSHFSLDFVVVNAENAAGGSGLTPEIYNALMNAGVDCITLGDHAFKQKSIYPVLNSSDSRIVRPANFPPDAPGRGWIVLEAPATEKRPATTVAVAALMGRVFMKEMADNPILAADKLVERLAHTRVRLLDFHAEATSETQMLGRYLDGRFSVVLGTHTHVATADERILPRGTAFQCDVGMTGAFESIIGRDIEPVLDAFRTCRSATFTVAREDVRLNGTIVDIDPISGKALDIKRLELRMDEALP
ncbi:MAG: TIGR00282 family metallophosphoesterase [Planctomycetia bacterium]|nr:TIGR00282 family metallophosphoesterase [Planctomycetia bacterium]